MTWSQDLAGVPNASHGGETPGTPCLKYELASLACLLSLESTVHLYPNNRLSQQRDIVEIDSSRSALPILLMYLISIYTEQAAEEEGCGLDGEQE